MNRGFHAISEVTPLIGCYVTWERRQEILLQVSLSVVMARYDLFPNIAGMQTLASATHSVFWLLVCVRRASMPCGVCLDNLSVLWKILG
jgi:hypothetical protein